MLINCRNNKNLLGRKREEEEEFNMVPLSAMLPQSVKNATYKLGRVRAFNWHCNMIRTGSKGKEEKEFYTDPLSVVLMQSVKNNTQVLINCNMVLENVKEMWSKLPKRRV